MSACHLNHLIFTAMYNGLMRNKALHRLDLSRNDLKDESLMFLAQVLGSGKSGLKNLDLSLNKMGNSSAIAIA